MKKSSFALGFAMVAMAVAPATARDLFYGMYGATEGVCHANADCSFHIDDTKPGKTYTVEFVATGRPEFNKVLCKVTATLTRQGDRLTGKFADGQDIEIVKNKRTASIVVSKTANRPCGAPLRINGGYEQMGD